MDEMGLTHLGKSYAYEMNNQTKPVFALSPVSVSKDEFATSTGKQRK